MKAIVLVAGYATRLYPLTENQPKGLLKLNNKTLIDYLFEKLEKVKAIDQAILVSNNKFYNHFKEWANNYKGRINVEVINDLTNSNQDRLGALGDLQLAIDTYKVDEDILVLPSDNYFTYEILDFYNFYLEKKTDCVIGSKINDLNTLRGFGVATVDESNKIIEIEEKPENPKSNIGIWASYIYTKDSVRLLKKYIDEGNNKDAPGHYPAWLCKRKPIYTYFFKGDCYDIGTPAVYYKLDEMLKNNK